VRRGLRVCVEFTHGSKGEQRCDVLWYKRAAFPIVCTSTFILLSREKLNETISCAPHAYDSGKLKSEHCNTSFLRGGRVRGGVFFEPRGSCHRVARGGLCRRGSSEGGSSAACGPKGRREGTDKVDHRLASVGRGGACGRGRLDAQGQGFGEDAELVPIGDGLEGAGDRVDKGGEIGEGEIVDNLEDVMEGPSHSTGNRCYFEGDAVGGETPAEENIPKLNRREEGPGEAESLVEVFCSTWEHCKVIDTESIEGGVRHWQWW